MGFAHQLHLTVAVDGLRAPVALEGAAARGGHVQAEEALCALPDGPVGGQVDQVPGRQRERVQVAQHGPPRVGSHRHLIAPGDARHVLRIGATGPVVHQLQLGRLGLSEHDGIGAVFEVELGMVGAVAAAHAHPCTGGMGQGDHALAGLAHHRQAHLREVVEPVVVDHHDVGPERIQLRSKLLGRASQGHVHHPHIVPGLA